MKVRDLMETKGMEVISMEGTRTVEDAIRAMGSKKISAIMITEEGRIAGIFTERDVVRCYINKSGRRFGEIPVAEAMTRDLVVAELDEDLQSAMSVMVEKNIRHLPVIDKGTVVGMLSVRDVVLTQVGKFTSEIHYLRDYISGY